MSILNAQHAEKPKKWLQENNIDFTDRHIVDENPTKDELKEVISKSGLPVRKLFNTSGNVYKSLNLKSKMDSLSEDEMLSFFLLTECLLSVL